MKLTSNFFTAMVLCVKIHLVCTKPFHLDALSQTNNFIPDGQNYFRNNIVVSKRTNKFKNRIRLRKFRRVRPLKDLFDRKGFNYELVDNVATSVQNDRHIIDYIRTARVPNSGKQGLFKRKKRSTFVKDELSSVEKRCNCNDTSMNNMQTPADTTVDISVENHMKHFLRDLINIFLYELKESATFPDSKPQHVQHHRQSIRPKRSIRSILHDPEVREILLRYFQQKGDTENEKALLRYG